MKEHITHVKTKPLKINLILSYDSYCSHVLFLGVSMILCFLYKCIFVFSPREKILDASSMKLYEDCMFTNYFLMVSI